jgi:hypothetical protein
MCTASCLYYTYSETSTMKSVSPENFSDCPVSKCKVRHSIRLQTSLRKLGVYVERAMCYGCISEGSRKAANKVTSLLANIIAENIDFCNCVYGKLQTCIPILNICRFGLQYSHSRLHLTSCNDIKETKKILFALHNYDEVAGTIFFC